MFRAARFPRVVFCLAVLCAAFLPGRFVQAQGNADRRRQYLDDIIKSLVESEMERRESLDQASIQSLTATTARGGGVSQRMQKARPLFEQFAQAASKLTTELDYEVDRTWGVRAIFGDVLKIRARAYVLAQLANSAADFDDIAEDFRSLDSEWRTVSYRLKQIPGLGSRSVDQIKQIDAIDGQLVQLFEIQAQVDNDALIPVVAQLTAAIDGIIDDIQIELEPSRERDQILLAGQKLHQQAAHLLRTVSDIDNMSTIVEEYKQFESSWEAFAERLRPYDNRYIQRSIRRVSHIDHELRQMLHLPQGLDRQQLLQLTDELKKDVDEFYTRAPLKLLITLPDRAAVIPTCDQFYGTCENFADGASRGLSREELIADYQYVEEGWRSFYELFRELKSSKAHQVLRDIENGILALRDALQIEKQFDREQAANLAASVASLADHLSDDIKTWLNNKPTSFRNDALREAAAFEEAARRLHVGILDGNTVDPLLPMVAELNTRWKSVHGYIKQCDTDDRNHLLRVTARVTPALVELQTRVR